MQNIRFKKDSLLPYFCMCLGLFNYSLSFLKFQTHFKMLLYINLQCNVMWFTLYALESSYKRYVAYHAMFVHISRVNLEEHSAQVDCAVKVLSTQLGRTVQKVCTVQFQVYCIVLIIYCCDQTGLRCAKTTSPQITRKQRIKEYLFPNISNLKTNRLSK